MMKETAQVTTCLKYTLLCSDVLKVNNLRELVAAVNALMTG